MLVVDASVLAVALLHDRAVTKDDDVFAKPKKVFLVVVPTGENDDHPSLIAIMDVPGYSHLTGRTMRYIAGQWIRVAEVVFNGWKNREMFMAVVDGATSPPPTPPNADSRPMPVPNGIKSYSSGSNIKYFIDKYEAILKTEEFPVSRWVPLLERCFEGPDLFLVKTEIIQ